MNHLKIRFAQQQDIPIILDFIRKLAEYEKLSNEVYADENKILSSMFSSKPEAESILGFFNNRPVAFAIFFHNYSTFLAQKGLYLEDLFVLPEFRNKGFGKKMLSFLAQIAVKRNCGRFEWAVLDWNKPAIDFYKTLGAEFKDEWLICRLTKAGINKLANIK